MYILVYPKDLPNILQISDNWFLMHSMGITMRKGLFVLMPLILTTVSFRGFCASLVPEPGPEVAGLRLRLTVTPQPQDGKEGYDVQADLANVSQAAISLQAVHWRTESHEGGFQEYVESALSIESYPAIEPWLGQVIVPPLKETAEPEYSLKPAETLSVKWYTTGRHLKNKVTNPLLVQNPEFIQSGLYSVHASVVISAAGREVRVRSNEQLVAFGGSREAPKHTYGPLWWTDEQTRTATLGLGSLEKVEPGDRFLIQSGRIGWTWTLTLTKVEASQSTGTLEPSRVSPTPMFPSRGTYGALIQK